MASSNLKTMDNLYQEEPSSHIQIERAYWRRREGPPSPDWEPACRQREKPKTIITYIHCKDVCYDLEFPYFEKPIFATKDQPSHERVFPNLVELKKINIMIEGVNQSRYIGKSLILLFNNHGDSIKHIGFLGDDMRFTHTIPSCDGHGMGIEVYNDTEKKGIIKTTQIEANAVMWFTLRTGCFLDKTKTYDTNRYDSYKELSTTPIIIDKEHYRRSCCSFSPLFEKWFIDNGSSYYKLIGMVYQ